MSFLCCCCCYFVWSHSKICFSKLVILHINNCHMFAISPLLLHSHRVPKLPSTYIYMKNEKQKAHYFSALHGLGSHEGPRSEMWTQLSYYLNQWGGLFYFGDHVSDAPGEEKQTVLVGNIWSYRGGGRGKTCMSQVPTQVILAVQNTLAKETAMLAC